VIWSEEASDSGLFKLRYSQYRMNGEPGTFIDGFISKVGSAGGGGSTCEGEATDCTKDWFLGKSRSDCGFSRNNGALNEMGVSSPLSIAITAAYDEAGRTGTLNVTAALDGAMEPGSGTINKISVLLYERVVTSSYGSDDILYAQLVRSQLLFEDFQPTTAGQQAVFTPSFTLDHSWVAENMGILVIVQNYTGTSSTADKKLIAGKVYNTGFLQSILASPPASRHVRPVSRP
jgi:hypothetical protein